MREPAIICMLVVNNTHYHAVTLIAQTHNTYTGIIAAIIAAITAGIDRATTAAVALTQTTTRAETVNAVVSKSAKVLQAQEVLNQHLYQAIHILKQHIDSLAEELALFRDMFLLACDPRFHTICLTPY